MKYLKIFLVISLIAYAVIILKGQMIGLPFLFWLAFTVFDFGNPDQIFALFAIAGLIIILRNRNKNRTRAILLTDFLCFILLSLPIIDRLNAVPLAMFNYSAFIIPTTIFVLCYLVALVYSCKQYLAFRRASVAQSGVSA